MFLEKTHESGESGQNPVETDTIFDVGTDDFEARVIHASMERPVIVDFWAPWCGPCKQLMPILEKAVKATGGKVLLAKVNLDENQQLAAALRVQSVPTVFAFYGGRPVDAFQGAQPESQITAFIDKLVQAHQQNQPESLDIPEVLKSAAAALSEGALAEAQGLYAAVLQQDEKNVEAYVGLIRTFIVAGTPEHAQEMINNAPEEIAEDSKFAEAKTALELATKAPSGDLAELKQKVAANPKDQQAKIDLAEAKFAGGDKEAAVEILLESIAQDREWNEEAARKKLLELFQAMGNADPLTIAARKKLSTLLFS